MKEADLKKYTDMAMRIKDRLRSIHAHLPYGLSNDDKAFLELVNDLLND